jgi:glycosyl transferase family 92
MTYSVYLAVCAMFRDEAPYLAEWVEFHRLVGVEHFYLYDNGSEDASRAVLAPWVREGTVSVMDCSMPLEKGGQAWAYADALGRARGYARWLAFIDIDEFLFSPRSGSLPEILAEFEDHPGVVVNWLVYGSSGLRVKPSGLVIESFKRRAPTGWVRNRRVKSIVDPQRALRARGPHFFDYQAGAQAVTESHQPVRIVTNRIAVRRLKRKLSHLTWMETDPYAINHSSAKNVSVTRLRINHYAVKSYEEFTEKMQRHRQPGDHASSRIGADYFTYHDRNEVHDPILLGYVPRLRAKLTRDAEGEP